MTSARAAGTALLALALTAAVAYAFLAPRSAARADSPLQIRVLSNRADLISGGDALVEVLLPAGTPASGIQADVDGRDVSNQIAVRANGRVMGLVTGLRPGLNRLTVRAGDAGGAQILITDHPIGGPIFAGPQVQPWICATTSLGLGPAQDAQCDTPPVYSYQYKSSVSGQFAPYDPASPPPDLTWTTTDQGRTVPYIVRRERGVIDRGIYDIAVLFQPGQDWKPWAPQAGWNRKLEILAGAGCEPGHTQQAPASNVLDDTALSRGFAVMINEMDDNTQDCNDTVQAEALMMTKEHLVESYGEIRYTIGQGCSGGSMTQHSTAANYPGIYDGIMPACSFPDIWTTYQEMADCKALAHYFDVTSPALWTEQQRAWASGHASAGTCEFQAQARSNSYVEATGNTTSHACAGNSWTYDPAANPHGVRCGIQDYNAAVFGTRPVDGFANRPFDNVGVQYGLSALEAGQIRPEQFVDLNEKVGGLDIDGNLSPARAVADLPAVETAYRSGRLTGGRELARVPIIDLRGSSNFEEHFDWHTNEFRNRLIRDNGGAGNMIYWEGPCCLLTYVAFQQQAFLLMDRWLAAIEADASALPLESRVLRDRPAEAVDACFIGSAKVTDMATCAAAYPYFRETRFAAGGPGTADVIKCRLQPLNRAGYGGVVFTDAQWQRMVQVFPDGVCDYSRPGLYQQPAAGPWMSFAGGPGGQILGAAPVSVPLAPAATASPTATSAPALSSAATGAAGPLPFSAGPGRRNRAGALLAVAGGFGLAAMAGLGARWRRRGRPGGAGRAGR